MDPDPYSGASWIRIRIRNTIRIHTCKYRIKWRQKMSDLRYFLTIQRLNWLKISLCDSTVCANSLKNILVLKKIIFLYNYFKFFLSKLIVLPWIWTWIWIRIQIGPKSWIRIQIQCIWIHNTAFNHISHWFKFFPYKSKNLGMGIPSFTLSLFALLLLALSLFPLF